MECSVECSAAVSSEKCAVYRGQRCSVQWTVFSPAGCVVDSAESCSEKCSAGAGVKSVQQSVV